VFIDKSTIKIASGRGGHGANTFRQEKFVAFGGPDGGDGGRGGSIWLEASTDLSTLLDFQYKSVFKADDGSRGSKTNKSGRSGEDLTIKVPVGTIVKDPDKNLTIADLVKEGERVLVAQGGRGGRGNTRFKSNKNRVPSYSEPGEPSIERDIELELKMIADVGIIGFPNAGKSTLISKISAAKPKIADYAFTTIAPNLGVVQKENGDSFVMADIPGLIEGASEGVGLGHDFLRHVERTRLLVHVVDVWGLMGSNLDQYKLKAFEDPLTNFTQVNYELYNYSPELATRKQVIVLNKIEGFPDEELDALVAKFEEYTGLKLNSFTEIENGTLPESSAIGLFAVSTLSSEGYDADHNRYDNGLRTVQRFIEQALELIPKDIGSSLNIDYDPVATDHDDSEFSIVKQDLGEKGITWTVHCGKLERHMRLVDLRDLESLNYFFRVTKGLGVIEALKSRGAEEGDTINIDGVDFELSEAVLV
jgi:GTP-binding protein